MTQVFDFAKDDRRKEEAETIRRIPEAIDKLANQIQELNKTLNNMEQRLYDLEKVAVRALGADSASMPSHNGQGGLL